MYKFNLHIHSSAPLTHLIKTLKFIKLLFEYYWYSRYTNTVSCA